MRLDKYIASTTDFSRSQVKKLVKSGDITVNDQIISDSALSVDIDSDLVKLYGNSIKPPKNRYFMLYKPEGYICSTQDSENPIVLDLLDEPKLEKLHIAGRLDKDTTGLVLITDDGQWNHRITSPKHDCFKRYRVNVEMPLTLDVVESFKNGIVLNNEKRPTLPAELIIQGNYQCEVLIQEGKYHQVKRMFAATGNRVKQLHRSQIGPLSLDPDLQPGDYRLLQPEEIEHFAK
ncbi:MAG: pseudouridine synthase [Cellvibrionaceae bacterium]